MHETHANYLLQGMFGFGVSIKYSFEFQPPKKK